MNIIPEQLISYYLTPEQLNDGWKKYVGPYEIVYRDPDDRVSDPAPGVPACQEWFWNGVMSCVSYYNHGQLCDPNPKTPCLRRWWNNGVMRQLIWFTNFNNGKGKIFTWDYNGKQTFPKSE